MIAHFDDISDLAQECFAKANMGAQVMQLNESRERSLKASSAQMIQDLPRFAELTNFYGAKAWAAILSVDLRRSSNRAVEIGARGTYLTMHTYLPIMAELVGKAEGVIVGLRGDGLFAAFGFTELDGSEPQVTSEVAGQAVQNASRCGKAMIEAVQEIINPILAENGIHGQKTRDLAIGVGIDVGDIVVTRIGLESASETTAYGASVNRACKFADGHNIIRVSHAAHEMYPTGKNGRIKFRRVEGSYIVNYPSDMRMLAQRPIGSIRPR